MQPPHAPLPAHASHCPAQVVDARQGLASALPGPVEVRRWRQGAIPTLAGGKRAAVAPHIKQKRLRLKALDVLCLHERNRRGHYPRPAPGFGRHRPSVPASVAGQFRMDFVSAIPQSAILTITPDLAGKLLASSGGNRRIRDWYVRMLAAAMQSGHWMVTSQGIGINLHGQLIDAHHRLTASVQGNVSFQSAVIWGLPEEAYQVTDRGIARSYEDILSCPKAVAEVLRHAGSLLVGNGRPTAQEIKPLIAFGMDDAVTALIKYCPSKRAYFSCAMFKLGAILRILDGYDVDFIYSQYRALITADYDSMTSASKAITRQATSGNLVVTNKNDVLARALVVFDPKKKNISKVQIDDDQRLAADEYARFVLRRAANGFLA